VTAPGSSSGFSVRLEPGGRVLAVAAGSTVLDAAVRGGVSIPHTCRSGLCRTCKGTLVSGRLHGPLADADDTGEGSGAEAAPGDVLLLCRAVPHSDCVLEVPGATELQFQPETCPVRIGAVERPAPGVAVLRLRLPMNRKLNFLAGQYLDVLLQGGGRRSYSIASTPQVGGIGEIELHVRHYPGGQFSDRLFAAAPPAGMLQIEAPLGGFFLRDEGTGPVILLATGTGFAPIQSMVEDAIRSGRAAREGFHVYWGAREAADLYRLERAMQWASEAPGVRFTPVLSGPPPQGWTGARGHVQDVVLRDFADLAQAQVYACGSEAMVESARRALVDGRALPEERFFADAFYPGA
jgi:CDP-4-dehydro-6-deoxyglucose reductase